MTEKLQLMGLTVVLGLLIVFSALIVLWIAIELMHFFVSLAEKPKKDEQKPAPEAIAPTAAITAAAPAEEDEGELIAVLTAAIAASLNTSTYNLKIKSFKRIKNASSAWKNA